MRLADITVPSTPACRSALEVVTRFSPPALVNHCVRSYLLAASRAVVDGIEVDHELLYVASLLHDLGLEEPFDAHAMAFEEAGAQVGWVFAAGVGWSTARRDRVAAVIIAHMQGTDPAVDPEGQLLDLATGLDISGVGFTDWPEGVLGEIVRSVPRLDLAARFTRCIRDQAERKPGSSAAAAVHRGIVGQIAQNRLDH